MIRLFLPETVAPVMTQKWITPENEEYLLRLTWNSRAGWFLGMSDRTDDPIFAPRAMLVNRDLFANIRDERMPGGALILYAKDGSQECSFEDLGTRCSLFYLTAAELA